MTDKISISVIVPCYNSEKHLSRCLDSVLNQTYDNYKVIAYNNESTDSTKDILERYQDKYSSKLEVIDIPNIYKNSYREAFEDSFGKCNTEYLTFIASDDHISDTYLEKVSDIISPRKNTIKCFQSGISIMMDNFKQADQVYKYSNIEDFKKKCMERSPVNTPSVFYHKDLYDQLIPKAHIETKKELRGAEDYDMFCNLADNDIFIYPYPSLLGYFYQLHEGQCTWSVHSERQYFDYDLMIQKYWGDHWNLQK